MQELRPDGSFPPKGVDPAPSRDEFGSGRTPLDRRLTICLVDREQWGDV
jgi:hypothetical protein